MKYLSILIIGLLMAFSATTNAQNGYSVVEAITVDLTTNNTTVLYNVSSQNSTSGHATGMQTPPSDGSCPSLSSEAAVIVYKVIIPQEGALHVSSNNLPYPNMSMGMIAYTATANPTTWTDLTYYGADGSIGGGNRCTVSDSLFIGRKYKRWSSVPYWALTGSTIAAGTYYVLFFNYNQTQSIGSASDVTFEFTPYCTDPLPDIAAEGSSTNIVDGDDTPSTTDDTDYGAIVSGASAISKTFTIKNTDPTTALNISNVNIAGTNAANFSITTSPASTVLGNSSTTMTVEFTPNTIGENIATVEITSDDCDEKVFNFDVKAFVTAVQPSSVRGNMLTLDGSNDYVEINNVAEKMVDVESFTLETWINADATQSGNDRIIAVNKANGDNRILFYLDDGILETFTSSGNVYTNSALYTDLADDLWHHLAFTHDGATNANSIYLDGQLVETETRAISDFLATDQWSIGQEFDGGSTGDFFKGKFDEVRIWKDVRTQAEIQGYKNLAFTIDQIKTFSNLVAYYQFDNDDATGTVDGVKDILGNHGTATNGGVYSASEVAVGNGIVERQAINAAGTADFSTLGVELEFITSGGESVPNGDIVITKITTETPNTAAIGKLTNEPTAYWVINNYGTNTNLNCNVKFKFDDGEISDAVIANHKIHKRGSNDFIAGAWVDLTPTNVSATAGDNHIKVNVNSFSQFSASSSTSNFVAVLPVELTYFKGRLTTERTTELIWQTATEDNNQGFEIQRSADGEAWESIGYKSGNGNSIQFQNYKFIDVSPLSGINYYRLKQLDFDGHFEYSNIVTIESKIENKPINIFPNPIQNELNIVNGQGAAMIYNLLGQPIKQFAVSSEQFSVDMSDLPKGQYVLRIQQENGTIVTRRFVKQ